MLRCIMRYTAADERDLIQRAQSGDRKASGLLVESMTGLIHREARAQSRRCNEPLDDLIQTASMGVLDAIRRFDPARGCRLITVALVRIRTALRPVVRRSLADDRRHVSIDTEVDPKHCRGSWKNSRAAQLMGLQVGPGLVADTPDPCDDIDTRSRHSEVTSAMAVCLTPREHMILRRATSERSESFTDIGASLRLSRETIRQDYESAVRKLRSISHGPDAPMTGAERRAHLA
jgi:RNA polymerase sigma factor (sigma-70 family)